MNKQTAANKFDRLVSAVSGRRTEPLTRQYALRLTRIKRLLAVLGHPERACFTVQVIGTSGKGSTAAMLSSILTAAGYRVGLSTKPALISLTEHFQVNGRPLSSDRLAAYFKKFMTIIGQSTIGQAGRPTLFELLTAFGAYLFNKLPVDCAIFEAGLGGRQDATTALNAPLKIFTTINLDHLVSLGPTIAKIATNKAAAIKPGDRVLSVATGAADRIIKQMAKRRRAHYHNAFQPLASAINTTWRGTYFSYRPFGRLSTNLIGPHQALNAAAALGGILELRKCGFTIPNQAIRQGLKSTNWPGRFQVIPGQPKIILDGAHNPGKVAALVKTLAALRLPPRRLAVIFAAKETKDAAGMLRRLRPHCRIIIFPKLASAHRLIKPSLLLGLIRQGRTAPSLAAAFQQARRLTGPNGIVLVTGSLILVGSSMSLLQIKPYSVLHASSVRKGRR